MLTLVIVNLLVPVLSLRSTRLAVKLASVRVSSNTPLIVTSGFISVSMGEQVASREVEDLTLTSTRRQALS